MSRDPAAPSREAPRAVVTMEFHVAREARDRYGLDAPWFQLTGNVVLADVATTRRLAHRMNEVRDAAHHPERAVHPGQLHAMGLIDEILHYVAKLYREQANAGAQSGALAWLEAKLGREAVDATLLRFTTLFPPLAVYQGRGTAESWLAGTTAGVPHREVALEELLMLWLANANPAFAPYLELFGEEALAAGSAYRRVTEELRAYFATQPVFGPDGQSLPDMLRAPAIASPHSLSGQLEYIRTRWGFLLGEFLRRLLVTIDVIREEERAVFLRWGGGAKREYSPVPQFHGLEHEYERFSPDREWMPQVVLMAKSAYVWLDQLSRRFGRTVTRLDHIPDEELDTLARWGITSLWLIGLWERSRASQRIKQMCGNPDAVASAYSLHDYAIAADLGGEEAYQDLRDRAWRRGIRLASDMVPNHMGIDSQWVVDHPDWFVGLDHSPFPSYRFEGPDVSWHPDVALQIEDHYYDRTDAAVVFRRTDRRTGQARFLYHGNDGTNMPWNDTAQLDYLKREVREAVIQTILHVARKFPVIRFDAAMTLAKRHYQRLWFPEPGTGGAIPSRAERGMTKAEFDAAVPAEFWREVVDRVAAEVPDTLLLAEAFWLMEGYFVRTLGMHRVYNSAFMNMLRDEDNASYRQVMKNTLEFDPEVLQRYVNFMNNPDERTAVDQFGKGDKYFGVCTLMVTLPGLPMFGHGQVEGYTEKYGMEFRRAYAEETADRWLVERHEREIFPLLHRRRVFAEAREFLLYDFYTPDGAVNEDVFAHSNRSGDDRALVVYHNRYATTAGWIRTSCAYALKTGRGEERVMRQRTLGEGLGLTPAGDRFCLFRDHVSGLEYVRSSRELCESGLFVQLDAYRSHVFLDFREVLDDVRHPWAELAHALGGRGVPSLEEALREIQLRPVLAPFRALASSGMIRRLAEARARTAAAGAPDASVSALLREAEDLVRHFVAAAARHAGRTADEGAIARDVVVRLEAVLAAGPAPGSRAEPSSPARVEPAAVPREGAGRVPAAAPARAPEGAEPDLLAWGTLCAWIFGRAVVGVAGEDRLDRRSREWLHGWTLDRVLMSAFQELGAEPWRAARQVGVVEAVLAHQAAFVAAALRPDDAAQLLESWLGDDRLRGTLRVHEYEGTWWFEKEAFEEMVAAFVAAAEVTFTAERSLAASSRRARLEACRELAALLVATAGESGYRLERLVRLARR